jgi:hypothetical protein
LKGSGVIIGTLHHLEADERDGLTIELISQEVVDSSAIEGEILDRAQVRALCEHFLRLDEAGKLGDAFAPPPGLTSEDIAAVEQEEGWILGA